MMFLLIYTFKNLKIVKITSVSVGRDARHVTGFTDQLPELFPNFVVGVFFVLFFFSRRTLMLAACCRVLNALGYKWTENWYNT